MKGKEPTTEGTAAGCAHGHAHGHAEWYFCLDSETVADLNPKAPTLAVP